MRSVRFSAAQSTSPKDSLRMKRRLRERCACQRVCGRARGAQDCGTNGGWTIPVGASRDQLWSNAEWYVARELRCRLGFDTAAGVKFHARGVGGDLDVVATAEGTLVYLELKSSPLTHLSTAEVSAFFDRLHV